MAQDRTSNSDDAPSWKKAWPFFVAVGLVLVLSLGIWISYLIRPADTRMSESAQVQHAINDVYTARNAVDYTAYRGATCAADVASDEFPTQEQFDADNRASMEENGPLVIPEITDLVVTGDRATAQVHWHFDKSENQKQVTSTVVVREDGDWKVCAS